MPSGAKRSVEGETAGGSGRGVAWVLAKIVNKMPEKATTWRQGDSATGRQGNRASHVPRALHMLHMSPELPFALHCKK